MHDRQALSVLDLFSGLGGWSAAFRDRGHRVTTLDLDARFGADFQMDLMDVRDLAELGGPFDVVLASPPCECFSVMTIGRNWRPGVLGFEARHERAAGAIALARHTLDLIERHRPTWWIIENPRAMLRKLLAPPTATVWYCRYGAQVAKPTDLWTNLRGPWLTCRPYNRDHIPAPRGSRTGVQGVGCSTEAQRYDNQPAGYGAKKAKGVLQLGTQMGASPLLAAQRALIPYRLSLAVCLACEDGGRLPNVAEVEALRGNV